MIWCSYNIQQLTDIEYKKWYDLAGIEKRNRIDRFRQLEDRKRSIAGEMLARQAIAKWCNVAPESIVFRKSASGKPFVQDLPVEFNISHSGNMVVCAVDEEPVGIDVECIRNVDWKLAERVCTKEEISYVQGKDFVVTEKSQPLTQEMLVRFFEIWTAKEAYFKCRGIGITDLKSVNVLPNIRKNGCIYGDHYVIHICRLKEM